MNSAIQKDVQAVRVVAPGGVTSTGSVTIRQWSGREKRQRAIKALAISWALGILAIAIPMLHFVLCPLLFIGGPIAARFAYLQKGHITGGETKCPGCGKTSAIHPANLQFPVFDTCDQCKTSLRILEELPT